MGNLLKFEIRKLFRQKAFYICLSVLLAVTFITILTFSLLNDFMAGFEDGFTSETESGVMISLDPLINTGAVGTVVTALDGADLETVLAIFIALFVCRDYTSGTIKNIVGKGYSRTKIIAAKAIVVCMTIGLYVIVEWLFAFIVGYAFQGITVGWSWQIIGTLAIQFVGALATGMLFMTISLLLRKTGSSIAVNIFISPVLSLIASLIDVIIHSESFSVGNYWLGTCFAQIARIGLGTDVMVRCGVCFAVYLVGFSVLPFVVGRKHEV